MPDKKHFIGFDILRICAAFMVYLFHIHINLGFRTSFDKIDKIISVGAVWMVCFFMLSGYTLMYKYEKFESDFAIKRFYLKRILSIYPSYLIFILIVFLFHCSFPPNKMFFALLIPLELFGLQAHFPKAFPYLGNGGTWFISVLFFLYLIFPYLVKLIQYMDKKKIYIILWCYIFTIFIGMTRMIFGGDFAQYYANPAFRIPEFLIGMILAKIKAENRSKKPSNNMVFCVCVLSAFFYCGVILAVFDIKIGEITFWSQNYLSYNFLVIPLFGILIMALSNLKFNNIPSLICAALNFGGKLTFPFYLTQTFANRLAGKWLSKSYFGIIIDGDKKIMALTLILNISFALLMYFFALLIKKEIVKKICIHA